MTTRIQVWYTDRLRFSQDVSKLSDAGVKSVGGGLANDMMFLSFLWKRGYQVNAHVGAVSLSLSSDLNGGGSLEIRPDALRVVAR